MVDMIQDLMAIATLTDTTDLDQGDDEDSISPAYVAELEFRLQRANARARKLVKNLADSNKPDADEVSSVVNKLETSLRSLSKDQAYAFMESSFRPEFFDEGLHPVMASAIKDALVKYCREIDMKPIYSIWSDV